MSALDAGRSKVVRVMKKMMRERRRAEKKPALVRGEPVVRRVLSAALEELARAGYQGMRIEDVAERADVNKTTVYRRWPTKEDLVRAALQTVTREVPDVPSTGSLRGDLLAHLQAKVGLLSSPEGQTLLKIMAAEPADSEVIAIAQSIHRGHAPSPRSILEAAAARGELKPGVDISLFLNVLRGVLRDRVLFKHEPIDEDYLAQVLDLLLDGIRRQANGPA